MKYIVEHKLIIVIATGIVLAALSYFTYLYISKSATIIVKHTPASARIYIDEKPASATSRVKPGSYTVSVSLDGFTTFKEQVTVEKNETHTSYAILESNIYYTADWYRDNVADGQLREQLLDEIYTKQAAEIEDNFPIISILPYTPPRGVYEINYGIGSKPNTQAVYISYYTDAGKKLAEEYIVGNGFKLEDYEIIYKQLEYGEPL